METYTILYAINPFQGLKGGDKFDKFVLKGKVGFPKKCMILGRIGLLLKLFEPHNFVGKLLRHHDVTTDMSSRTGKKNKSSYQTKPCCVCTEKNCTELVEAVRRKTWLSSIHVEDPSF